MRWLRHCVGSPPRTGGRWRNRFVDCSLNKSRTGSPHSNRSKQPLTGNRVLPHQRRSTLQSMKAAGEGRRRYQRHRLLPTQDRTVLRRGSRSLAQDRGTTGALIVGGGARERRLGRDTCWRAGTSRGSSASAPRGTAWNRRCRHPATMGWCAESRLGGKPPGVRHAVRGIGRSRIVASCHVRPEATSALPQGRKETPRPGFWIG